MLDDVRRAGEWGRGLSDRQEVRAVRGWGRWIADVLGLTLDEALEYFADDPKIVRRLRPLSAVGYGIDG